MLAGVLVVPAAVVREVTVRKEEVSLMAFLETALINGAVF